MKRIYIKKGCITYSVKATPMVADANVQGEWLKVSIKMVGERFPEWGSALRSTENVREFANKVIDTWVK